MDFSRHLKTALFTAPAMALVLGTAPAKAQEDLPRLEIYGFGMVDYIQDLKRVNPAWQDTLRPSKIPTTKYQYGSDGQASVSPKQSRFGVMGNLPVEGTPLKTRIEFDFFGVGPDEGQTTIRLRHAYGSWKNWLGGQTNSLFMDGDVFPNVIDYWGPAGMVFLRTPQIRWTPVQGKTTLAFAIENPSNDIDPGLIREIDPDLGAAIKNDEKAPDLTAMLRTDGDWGHIQLSGILRRVGYDTPGNNEAKPKGNDLGWGASLTSVLKARRAKLYLSGTYGEGIASYMNDGGTDLGPDGELGSLNGKSVPLLGLMAYFEQMWNDKWSTSLGYALTQVQNTRFQAGSSFKKGEYASINLLNAVDKNILVGGEVLWGRRTDRNGDQGEDFRTQISLKYSFSSRDWAQAQAR